MLVYDLVEPRELVGYVRGVQRERDENRFQLSQFLPNVNLDDIEFRVTQGEFTDEEAATYRAWDAESPIGGRQGLSRLMGELPPLSRKIPLGEEARLRRRALERGTNAGLLDGIYNDARKMARAIAARIELARGDALVNGRVTINENGVVQTVDYGRDATHNVTAAVAWSNHTTSTPIEDLLAWVDVYRDTNGVDPAGAIISNDIWGHLLMNDSIRTYAGLGQGASPNIVTGDTVRGVLAAYGLPPLARYDTKVRVNGAQQRVIPADRVIFMPPGGEPLGSTFFGTTVEALELVEARQIAGDDAPGLIAVVEKTSDPVRIWTKVGGIALPVLINPNLTFVADVL